MVDGDRLSQFCSTILSKLWRGGEPEGVFRRGRGWSDVELLLPPAQDFPQRELDLPVQQREPHLDCPDHPLLAGKHLPHNVSSGGKKIQHSGVVSEMEGLAGHLKSIYPTTLLFQDTGASIDAIFFWYEKCRQFFGQLEDEVG